MPLSKARMRERKRQNRADVKPMSNLTPNIAVKPKSFSKEQQLRVLMPKKRLTKQTKFNELRTRFDYRNKTS